MTFMMTFMMTFIYREQLSVSALYEHVSVDHSAAGTGAVRVSQMKISSFPPYKPPYEAECVERRPTLNITSCPGNSTSHYGH